MTGAMTSMASLCTTMYEKPHRYASRLQPFDHLLGRTHELVGDAEHLVRGEPEQRRHHLGSAGHIVGGYDREQQRH